MSTEFGFGGLGSLYDILSKCSARPRYALLLLQLVAELADGNGQAGPFIDTGSEKLLLRDWLSIQLNPLSERCGKRPIMEARIKAEAASALTGDAEEDAAMIRRNMEQRARVVGRANVSRSISDLVKAGLMTRYYSGYATDHCNRGGGRHAVYVVAPNVLRLLRPDARNVSKRPSPLARQGDLFDLRQNPV